LASAAVIPERDRDHAKDALGCLACFALANGLIGAA
jgi:hypothetical protein